MNKRNAMTRSLGRHRDGSAQSGNARFAQSRLWLPPPLAALTGSCGCAFVAIATVKGGALGLLLLPFHLNNHRSQGSHEEIEIQTDCVSLEQLRRKQKDDAWPVKKEGKKERERRVGEKEKELEKKEREKGIREKKEKEKGEKEREGKERKKEERKKREKEKEELERERKKLEKKKEMN